MFRRRVTFLINRSFQLKFSLYVCSWIFILSLIYPIIIYDVFSDFIQVAVDVKNDSTMGSDLEEIRKEIFMIVSLAQGAFIFIVFLLSIFLSHRIAGPIYKLTQAFNKASLDGKLVSNVRFRKKDNFLELEKAYNNMVNYIESNKRNTGVLISKSISTLQSISGSIDTKHKEKIEEALSNLRKASE